MAWASKPTSKLPRPAGASHPANEDLTCRSSPLRAKAALPRAIQNQGLKQGSGQGYYPAFMAYKKCIQVGYIGDIVLFDALNTNEGEGFDLETGIFNCSIPGLYVFSFSILTEDNPIINLVKNGDSIATVFRSYDGAYVFDTMSNQAVIRLEEGDHVYLQFEEYDQQSVYGDPYWKYSSFSGYLIA